MKEIYEKLFILQKEQIKLKKDSNNPFFKSKYISLDNILEVYEPLFIKNDLLCLHYSKDNKLITELIDLKSEEKVSSEFNIYNNDPQKQGSEITYWKRYNLSQLLNIQTDTDDDWNKASSWWNTKEYYKDERWLKECINDMKYAKTKEDRIKYKDEWKTFAKSEKQLKWLADEWTKL